MNKTFIIVVSIVAVIGLVLVFNAASTVSQKIVFPSEALKSLDSFGHKRVRVVGRVAAEPIDYQVEPEIKLTFSIQDPPKQSVEDPAGRLKVIYYGIKPDMFAVGRDVIIDGSIKEGTLLASQLQTQCPSKYEPPKPEAEKKTK